MLAMNSDIRNQEAPKPQLAATPHGDSASQATVSSAVTTGSNTRTSSETKPKQPETPLSRAALRVPTEEVREKSKRGEAQTTLRNFDQALTFNGIRVSFNLVKKRLEIKQHGRNFDDLNVAFANIQSVCERNGLSTAHLLSYSSAISRDNAYHPVAEWIRSAPWDRVDRLSSFYSLLKTEESFPALLKQVLMRKWLLSATAAALKPKGFQSRGVLVLQGRQSLGKTSFFRSLLPDHLADCFLPGHHLDPSNKDSLITAISHWIVELGELDSTFKKDIARLKGTLTADVDKVRRPYERADSEYPRQTVFGASVNEAAFLVDPTGNTRFWTIPVISIDYKHKLDLQQLYAQLAVSFDAGDSWHLTHDEEQQLEEHNSCHQVVSSIMDLLQTSVDHDASEDCRNLMTARETLVRCGIQHPSNGQCRDAGAYLRQVYGAPKKINGSMKWRVALRVPATGFEPTMSHAITAGPEEEF